MQHDLIQGTDEWCAFRLTHFGASEASAMLGISKKVKRNELLHAKSTGIPREFGDWVQKNILDYGHEVEALARPIVDDIIGAELFPVTLSKGKLSYSSDGIVMDDSVIWENKQYNAEYFDMVLRGELPDEHWPQCQQGLYVSGAEKLYFTISDGTPERTVGMWVYPYADKQQKIIDGWAMFEKDLAAYVPAEIIEPPKAEPIKDLPMVTVQVRGELTLCNLNDITPLFDKFLSEAKTELVTDDDFAQAEAEAKLGRETAKRCKLTAKAVVDQMLSISEVTRTLEDYAAKFDALALRQEKAVKEQKETRKTMAKLERDKAYAEHITALNAEIAPIRLEISQADKPDFVGAMKGQRTLVSLFNKLDSELASAKIAADAVAKDVRRKLAWFNETYGESNGVRGFWHLFPDMQSVILTNQMDSFRCVVESRIHADKQAEIAKLEAERQRIRQEEEAKARREAAEILHAEQRNESPRYREQVIEPALKRTEEPSCNLLTPWKEECRESINFIEKQIKALEIRIEAGDMNIHDALVMAYQIGLKQSL